LTFENDAISNPKPHHLEPQNNVISAPQNHVISTEAAQLYRAA
jgi:hypothetical protein